VAITPASGFVKPLPALAIGVAAGIGCYLMVSVAKARFGYDDSLDVFGATAWVEQWARY
jgi:Amt family ammonium transporter